MAELCPVLGFGHRVGEQVGILGGSEERADRGVVEGLGREPFGGTRLGPVALAPPVATTTEAYQPADTKVRDPD